MRAIRCLKKMLLCLCLVLFSVSALVVVFPVAANAEEVMSWNARTPAGGRDFIDPNYFLRVATAVEWGSRTLFNSQVKTTTKTTTSVKVTQGESRTYGPGGTVISPEGELVLLDASGKPIQKGPTESYAFDSAIGQYFYFTPQLTESIVSQKTTPKRNP